MPLSTDTLIHYTKKKSALKKILSSSFKIFYCQETIELNSKANSFHVPMVSFCDIPLSQVKDHVGKYGNYGIGLTKEWGLRNGLNPVLYISKTSLLGQSIKNALRLARQSLNEGKNHDEVRSMVDVLRYIKNYEADLIRKGKKTIHNYRFYDEREWRYVPSFTEDLLMIFAESNTNTTRAENEIKLQNLSLKFEPKDIKYIIIAKEAEVPEFIAHLRKIRGHGFTPENVDRLITRIITVEQIKSDM